MYRATDIKEGLLHLLGWRQNHNASTFTISAGLTASDSGQYFQDIHPLLTLDNIRSVAPPFEDVVYEAWFGDEQYAIGDRVALSGVKYRALSANTGKKPSDYPAIWEVFDEFSLWLEQNTGAGILQAIADFYNTKLTDKTLRNILESKTLFDGAGRISDTISNQSRVVGFELIPLRAKGVTVRIDRIGLQFTEAGVVKLYLMHSSQTEPIQEIEVTRTKAGGMEWYTPTTELLLPYNSDGIDAGGSWYLVYAQDELPGTSKAVNKSRDWSKGPCSTCNPSEMAAWSVWSRYLEVHPFYVSGLSAVEEMWDVANNIYSYTQNYGINLQLTVLCDLTEFILDQKTAFQNVIGLQVATHFLRLMALNPDFKVKRALENMSMQTILYELDGDSQSNKKSGLVYRLTKAMEAVNLDMSGLSKACLPCGNGGIRYRTA